MRFIIMHRTNAHWESGATPGPELLQRVGGLLGKLAAAGLLDGAEGLRPSSDGARLSFSAGSRTVTKGPFVGDNELPSEFTIVRAKSLDEAIEWTTRQAEILGDMEVDVRPVTEPWDIGVAAPPDDANSRRYMILRKATAATEAGRPATAAQQTRLSRLIDETRRAGQHLVTETMRPSRRGRRYTNSRNGVSVYDGPFAETKELIGGYVIITADSLEAVHPWAMEYIRAVEADEVDVRELA
jgi:hypothetical protein